MVVVRQRARFDWMIELGGASALGLGCAYAALKLAPSFAVPPPVATISAMSAFFAIGLLVMRTVPGRPAERPLADFVVAPLETSELLLDTPLAEPLLLDTPYEKPGDVLLLEDALPRPDPASRVVQLFASLSIDGHPAAAPERPATALPDASNALYAALDQLRRSLR